MQKEVISLHISPWMKIKIFSINILPFVYLNKPIRINGFVKHKFESNLTTNSTNVLSSLRKVKRELNGSSQTVTVPLLKPSLTCYVVNSTVLFSFSFTSLIDLRQYFEALITKKRKIYTLFNC